MYVGGSIDEAEYRRRRKTRPEAIWVEFLRATGSWPASDLLVCPFPPPSRVPLGTGATPVEDPDGIEILPETAWQSLLRKRFVVHLVSELLRARQAPLPSFLAFVGFSAGAYLAVGLTLDLPLGRGAAIVGGTGMAEAMVQSAPAAWQGKAFLALAGNKDPLAPRTDEWGRLLSRKGIEGFCRRVPAGHSFAQYAACGAIREAFAFTLGRMGA